MKLLIRSRQAWLSPSIAAAAYLAWCGDCRAAGDPTWIHLHSPGFEEYSSAAAGPARETLRHFEFVRRFFEAALGGLPPESPPVYLVVFGSAQAYAPYRSHDWEAASYQRANGRDMIAVGDASQGSFSTAVHEYFHLWARRRNLRLPLWLNEGLAQLYSTLRLTLGGQVVGEAPAGFARQVARYGWIPLGSVLSARQYPHAGDSVEVTSYYLESWALAHMVELSADYRGRASKILPAIEAGMSSEKALTKIYDKPLSEIETDLQGYLQVIEDRYETYRVKLPKPPKPGAIEPAAEFDRRLILIQLLAGRSGTDEAREELEGTRPVNPCRCKPVAPPGSRAYAETGVQLAGSS